MNMITNHLPTAELQALDAAHHMHPFTDSNGLAAKGALSPDGMIPDKGAQTAFKALASVDDKLAAAKLDLSPQTLSGQIADLQLAMGVHAYHLPPIGFCFAAAMASEIAQKRPKAWLNCARAAGLVLGGMVLTAILSMGGR